MLESLERELRDLSAALERIDAGTYGVCEGCEQPIAEERLEAQPAARFCTEHAPRR
ncbi:MAG: TraR/DksA C4-type zinc finger protein [Actinobacteria bacterium]|nr:TraR/DksA C4-type zinc finger protein [Actinomycetota bacterium]